MRTFQCCTSRHRYRGKVDLGQSLVLEAYVDASIGLLLDAGLSYWMVKEKERDMMEETRIDGVTL